MDLLIIFEIVSVDKLWILLSNVGVSLPVIIYYTYNEIDDIKRQKSKNRKYNKDVHK